MRKRLFICRAVFLAGLMSVGVSPPAAECGDARKTLRAAGFDIDIAGDLGEFRLDWKVRKIEKDLDILALTLSSGEPAPPPAFSLKWSHPSFNVAGFWSTGAGFGKSVHADWGPSRVVSMFSRHAPVTALLGYDDRNILNVAVSDALNTVRMSAGLREEDGRIYHAVDFFREKHRELKEYRVDVRFDRRPVRYDDALREVPGWWASFPGYEPAPVPDAARLPMYSTWYSYHQNVSAEALLKEAEAARRMGFTALIVDDGWQTLDSSRGYAHTGDWRPLRIPDMKGFVDALHGMDMKVLLWYAVPFMGEKAGHFERFRGKYLRYWEGQGAYVLDPRYPEVREYVIDVYRRALKDWGLDGFKLDFIARFAADDGTVLERAEGRDFASVNEAADRLMTDIMSELRKIKHDVMIEFRQPYIGPLMRKYGNMFRVGDCPNMAITNRVGMVDLRLSSGGTAVHSDMIMWHYGEKVETAALQFLNILFAVPQVSVRLEDIPPAHFEMIEFMTGYWTRNRSILLDGRFRALQPRGGYPVVSAWNGEKRIVAVYSDHVIRLEADDAFEALDIVNAKATTRLVLDAARDFGSFRCRVYDCRGRIERESLVTLDKGLNDLEAPGSGLIALERRRRP